MKRISIIGILVASLLGAGLTLAMLTPTETQIIPRKLIFGNPEKASPTISPDGQQLAYLAPDSNDVLNIWVQPTDGHSPALQVTSDKKQGVRQFLWQYDNQHILYLQDVDGDENWHVYQVNLASKITRDLTPFHDIRSDLVAYSHKQPNALLVQMNLRDRSQFDIYRVDLTTGGITLDTINPDEALALIADHNLVIRAAQSYTEEGGTLVRIRKDAQSPWTELLRWGPEETLGHISHFSPDNQSLLITTSLEGDTAGLLQVDLETGKRSLLASDPQYDVGSILAHPTTHEIEAIRIERERQGWIQIGPEVAADFAELEKLGGGSFEIVSRSLDNTKWIVGVLNDIKPPQYYLYDRNSKDAKFLFSSRPKIEKYKLSPMQAVQLTAIDGLKLHGYLTLPAGRKARNLPMVLLVHGGPWVRDSWGYNPQVQWLTNRGYAVLQINYRGSTGYGKAHLNAGNREWGRNMHQDLLDAKQWAIDQGYADPAKIAIFGGSYGGYATLAALAFTPKEFCCGVDIVGPSSLITLLKTIPPYWKPVRAQFDRRVGNLDTEQELLIERSPLHKADQIARPLLIGQGAHDPRVKQSESDQIVAAMRKNNQEVEYLLFPNEGHGFTRPSNRLKFYAAAENFLAKQLGGREEAPEDDEQWEDVRQ